MTINLTVALALCLFGVFLAGVGILLSGLARACDSISPHNPLLKPPALRTLMIIVPLLFLELLTLLFITLKLTSVIAWSWWWVTVPLWGIPVFLGSWILGDILVSNCWGLVSRFFSDRK